MKHKRPTHINRKKNEKAVESEYVMAFVTEHAIAWGFDPSWLQAANNKKVKQEEKQKQLKLQQLFNHKDAQAPRWQRRSLRRTGSAESAPGHVEDPSVVGSCAEAEDHSDSESESANCFL